MPELWEYRTTLFVGYLVDKGFQSGTVKSYVSVIKRTLTNDNYKWKEDSALISSLARACKLKNDCVRIRLPMGCSLLELVLFEVQRHFQSKNQVYLEHLYLALFALGYYGLMRVGELTFSQHVVKAKDIHFSC